MNKSKASSNNIYNTAILTKKVYLNINDINAYVRNKLETKLKELYEDKCNIDGFIKKNSIKLLNYSSGKIDSSNKIMFQTTIQCQLCNPINDMIIDIKVLNITKAGIRGDVNIQDKSPMMIFLARDHHFNINEYFDIKENDIISVKILGHRFELNDNYISVIAEYKKSYKKTPKIVIPSLNVQNSQQSKGKTSTQIEQKSPLNEKSIIGSLLPYLPESEPKASEPKASEPKASEPKASEATSSEPTSSEPKASEPKASEAKASEATKEKSFIESILPISTSQPQSSKPASNAIKSTKKIKIKPKSKS